MGPFTSPSNKALFCAGSEWSAGDAMSESVERLGSLIGKVHVRDSRERGPKCEEIPLGSGGTEFRDVVAALHRIGYDGLIRPEHVGTVAGERDRTASAAMAVGFIRGIFHALGIRETLCVRREDGKDYEMRAGAVVVLAWVALAAEAGEGVKAETVKHRGIEGCVEITAARTRLVVVPAWAGRISVLDFGAGNVLWTDPKLDGKDGRYPHHGGANSLFWIAKDQIELEPLSGEVALSTGESMSFTQVWQWLDLPEKLDAGDAAAVGRWVEEQASGKPMER